ncbi:hypothetical protein ACHAQI_006187 [Fusarium lateritium]
MTMIKKTIRKIDVVVVPRARTSTSTKTMGKTTTTRAEASVDKATKWITKTRIKTVDVPVTETATEIERVTSVQNSGTTNIPVSSDFTLIKNDASYTAKRRHNVRAAANALSLNAILKMKVPNLSARYIATTMQGPRRTLKAQAKWKTATATNMITEQVPS